MLFVPNVEIRVLIGKLHRQELLMSPRPNFTFALNAAIDGENIDYPNPIISFFFCIVGIGSGGGNLRSLARSIVSTVEAANIDP